MPFGLGLASIRYSFHARYPIHVLTLSHVSTVNELHRFTRERPCSSFPAQQGLCCHISCPLSSVSQTSIWRYRQSSKAARLHESASSSLMSFLGSSFSVLDLKVPSSRTSRLRAVTDALNTGSRYVYFGILVCLRTRNHTSPSNDEHQVRSMTRLPRA